jgi:uncharacterized protein YndB with AHSA1/START domain
MAEVVDAETLRFERELRHPIDRVWAAVSTPAGLAGWMAEATLEPREGGAFELRWDEGRAHGRVVRWQPPALLECTWKERPEDGESTLCLELAEVPGGTRLVLTHSRLRLLAGFGAGWHAHLDMLAGLLDGRPVDWAERWAVLEPRYREHVPA